MTHGSCLCGQVRFDLTAPLHDAHLCHCGMCRKAHGSAFSAFGMVERPAFRVVAGEALVRSFRSSPVVLRSFCSACGSPLTFDFEGMPNVIFVSLGAIDGDPGVRVDSHMFVGSKAPWFEITDGLPQHAEYPPMPGQS